MVELMAINKALPGDNPIIKKKKSFSKKMMIIRASTCF
jgi:hypothetical protein